MKKQTARHCAADILHGVLERRLELAQLLATHEELAALEARDRNFCRLLVLTVLRRLGEVDALLERYIEKPLPASLCHVQHCLRLGVVQLLFLETPAHAAVHDTVELLANRKWQRHKGLVNAVLKRVAREGQQTLDEVAHPGINMPEWLWKSWVQAYGAEQAEAMAGAQLRVPPLDVSVASEPARWVETLQGEVLSTGSIRLAEYGKVADMEGYAEGAWWVQDAAAALPAKLLGDIAGKHVLDLCAAPGGKTAQLVAMGAQVTAVERSASRLKVLKSNLQRLEYSANIVQADIMKWQPDGGCEAILLDAPCSATGTLRRHPDVAWHRTPEDVTRLAAIQRNMLERAAGWLAPGGVLIYCVCSLQPEEGEQQVAEFVARNAAYARLPMTAEEVGGCAELLTVEGDLRTLPCHWPQRGGMDGFYAARLQRVA